MMVELNCSIGDKAIIKTKDGGGRVGIINKITKKGVHIDVGNKKPVFYNFVKINEITMLN